jgi:hypothetical protein
MPGGLHRDEPAGPWRVYAAMVLALALAAWLSTSRIAASVERLPLGRGRDAAVVGARLFTAAAARAGLDRPERWVASGLGRADPGPGARPPATRAPTAAAPRPSGGAVRDPTATPAMGASPLPPENRAPVRPDRVVTAPAALDRPRWPADTPAPAPSRTARMVVAAETPDLTDRDVSAQPAQPIYVLVAGDSMAEPLGYELRDVSADEGLVRVRVEFRISSGLSRPDYFDWPAHMAAVIAEFTPDFVVWHSGGNDAQNLQTPEGVAAVASPEWAAEYGRRVAQLMDVSTARGTRMYWLGLPPIRDEPGQGAAQAINAAAARAAASRALVTYLDLAPMFAGHDGAFAMFANGADGQPVKVRQEDGVHLSVEGTAWVADLVYGHALADSGVSRPSRDQS